MRLGVGVLKVILTSLIKSIHCLYLLHGARSRRPPIAPIMKSNEKLPNFFEPVVFQHGAGICWPAANE
jgi:hypothetical protein